MTYRYRVPGISGDLIITFVPSYLILFLLMSLFFKCQGLLVGDESKLEESLKECIEEETGGGDVTANKTSNVSVNDTSTGSASVNDSNSTEVFVEAAIREESLNTILANENLLGTLRRIVLLMFGSSVLPKNVSFFLQMIQNTQFFTTYSIWDTQR
jgi:hypothetical protein